MTIMGSSISIGFVYGEFSIQAIENEIKRLVKYFVTTDGSLKKMKVSKDIDGEEWLEYDSLINLKVDSIYTTLAENYYGQVEVNSSLFGHKNLTTTIRIEKEEDEGYFGFLLDIDEEELIKTNLASEINSVTEKIVDFITGFYSYSAYDYAFCDNEAEIQYSPRHFKKIESSIYSISVIPTLDGNSNSLNIVRSNWNIDGLTSRI
ncbi:hypothetical protein FDF58_07570 [Clostridium argentinense]|nr:hypothetical protein [Clostridium argentinense]NFP72227.1 hypothetical protein [Clostridium argentinense]NFP76398.1 hypothetical protein [Clostridium argentinense]